MAAKDEQQKKRGDEEVSIDYGVGRISFGGLFQGLGTILDLVSQLEAEGKEAVEREGEFTSPSGRVKAVYGLSIKTNLGGRPTVEPFGNVRVKKTARGPVIEDEREPLVDVFDESDHITVIAEMPGVEEERINISVQGDILTLSASGSERKYYKELVLPASVDAASLTSKYKNGVLEIRVNKQ
jgi:HSP20 family protein